MAKSISDAIIDAQLKCPHCDSGYGGKIIDRDTHIVFFHCQNHHIMYATSTVTNLQLSNMIERELSEIKQLLQEQA